MAGENPTCTARRGPLGPGVTCLLYALFLVLRATLTSQHTGTLYEVPSRYCCHQAQKATSNAWNTEGIQQRTQYNSSLPSKTATPQQGRREHGREHTTAATTNKEEAGKEAALAARSVDGPDAMSEMESVPFTNGHHVGGAAPAPTPATAQFPECPVSGDTSSDRSLGAYLCTRNHPMAVAFALPFLAFAALGLVLDFRFRVFQNVFACLGSREDNTSNDGKRHNRVRTLVICHITGCLLHSSLKLSQADWANDTTITPGHSAT